MIIKTLKVLFLSAASLAVFACVPKYDLTKVAFIGNQLRMDGLFYSISDDGENLLCDFFYRDGVILYGGIATFEEIDISQEDNRWWPQGYKEESRGSYGVFTIDNDNIFIERWIPGAGRSQTQESYGQIINDSTITITKIINNLYNTEEDVEIELKFYPFSPKPDSTNTFIK